MGIETTWRLRGRGADGEAPDFFEDVEEVSQEVLVETSHRDNYALTIRSACT